MMGSLGKGLILLALPILIGIVEWHYIPDASPSKVLHIAAEPWQLPVRSKSQPDKALEALNKISLWGKLPDAGASTSLSDPDWHFLGIVTNGPERFVLIKIEGQPEQKLTVNDKLPGGGKILKIGDDNLCLLVNGKKRSLGIYQQGPQAI